MEQSHRIVYLQPVENSKITAKVFKAPSGSIPGALLSIPESTNELAVVFPGAGYSWKMPLLYYSIDLLLLKGYQVLAIDKVYADDATWCGFRTRESAFKYVEDDTVELFAQITTQFSGQVKVLLGRSLGTFQIACALEHNLIRPQQIVWQTPSLYEKWPIINSCGVPGFAIIGTIDQRYETAFPHLPQNRIIVEGADHSMEIPGSPIRSIEVLGKVIEATNNWVKPAGS